MNYRSKFIEFYFNRLAKHPTFKVMGELAEESPWHREDSIAIHTNMVVGEYLTRAGSNWTQQDLLGALACAFHDFGKPAAMEVVFKEERGHYKRFTGHELLSARMWEDFICSSPELIDEFGLTAKDIYKVSWMCEHHLPWAVEKNDKRQALALTSIVVDDPYPSSNIFERVLLSDTYGRISDDAETKQAKSEAWVEEFIRFKNEMITWDVEFSGRPTLYMSIGAPGCGKSTYRKNLSDDVLIHNMDQMRLDWYGGNYNEAFARSNEDKGFSGRVHSEFMTMIKTGKDVYCDNTNGSAKRRRFYLTEAKRRSYRTVAVLFPVSLDTVLARQHTREDKCIPEHAVRFIYNNLQMPQYGEFDDITVESSNLICA